VALEVIMAVAVVDVRELAEQVVKA